MPPVPELADRRVVWILGAGFSRSLGGPLLGDLLSPASLNDVNRLPVGNRPKAADIDLPCLLFHWGKGTDVRTWGQLFQNISPIAIGHLAPWPAKAWEDAEAFLVALEDEVQKASMPSWLHAFNQWLGANHPGSMSPVRQPRPTAKDLLVGAKRLVAAQCLAFLEGSGIGVDERWRPYEDWAQQLDGHHAIVSFNYDDVVERLAGVSASPIRIMLPDELSSISAPPSVRLEQARFYKLHGSTDWTRSANGIIRTSPRDRYHAITCGADAIALATPGREKLELAAKLLKPLWDVAELEIRHADTIVFMGYRFPPSDPYALKRIFQAIEFNAQPYLSLHLVLGPNRADQWSQRLRGLLEAGVYPRTRSLQKPPEYSAGGGPAGHFDIVADGQPMLAEDFMTVVKIERLLRFPWEDA